MTTIIEDYVSFETAKLLKDKGFAEYTFGYYSEDGIFGFNEVETRVAKGYQGPTLQMAIKWFRKKYNFCIISLPIVTDDDGEAGCLWNYMISKRLETLYNSEDLYECPEIALNNAIKYCLENLI